MNSALIHAYLLIAVIVGAAVTRAISWPLGEKNAAAIFALCLLSLLIFAVSGAFWPLVLGIYWGKKL